MRVRPLATVAALGLSLLSPSFAGATQPTNTAVESSQLRNLMVQRRALIETLTAQDGPRGQLLTLGALSAADAILSADLASLQRSITRLTPRPRPHVKRSPRVRPVQPATTTPDLVAGSGILWAPGLRRVTEGLPPSMGTRSTTIAQPRPHVTQTVMRPLPLRVGIAAITSLAPYVDTATILSATPALPHSKSKGEGRRAKDSAQAAGGAASASQASQASHKSASGRDTARVKASVGHKRSQRPAPAHQTTIPLAAFDAPLYGRLTLGGSSGPLSLAATNETVAAAMVHPVAVPHVQQRRRASAHPAHRDQVPSLDVLQQRWRVVAHALVQVRALEEWTRSNALTPVITAHDVITSTDALPARLDRWSARPALGGGDVLPSSAITPSVPEPVLGATLALSRPVTSSVTAGEDVSGTLAVSGTDALLTSRVADAPITATAPPSSAIELPISTTSTAALTTSISSTTMGVTPTVPPAQTPVASGLLSDSTATPDASGLVAEDTATPDESLTATAPLTAVSPFSAAVPMTATAGDTHLDLSSVDGTPALTVTVASATDPLTLSVTLPMTSATTLAPPDFWSKRGALESVLRQGEALYTDLESQEAGVEASYHAHLAQIVAINGQLERNYYARYYAWQRYQKALATYKSQAQALNRYLQRRHAAQVAHDLWVQRSEAWAAYARQLKAYGSAVAVHHNAPIAPISGTASISDTATAPVATLPPKPVAPVWPGPEPAPFTETQPPFPVSPGPAVPNPGPEPAGNPLPAPPDAVPPWDNLSLPVKIMSFGGLVPSVNAIGHEEITQDALISDGALDGGISYIDPVKGFITTYWGGSTPFQAFHPAVDIAAYGGEYTPVHAAAAGKVVWAGLAVPGDDHASYGNCVIIQHNDHFSTLYAHMDDKTHPLAVHVGDIVQQGQVIGYEGMTGWTTGPHVHFEIRYNNIEVNPLLLIPNPQS